MKRKKRVNEITSKVKNESGTKVGGMGNVTTKDNDKNGGHILLVNINRVIIEQRPYTKLSPGIFEKSVTLTCKQDRSIQSI